MKKYTIKITAHAERSLKKLHRERDLIRRLDARIQSLTEEPRPTGCKKLKSGRYDNLYRIREGDWRIFYAVEDDRILVLILDVVRRDQAYR